MLGDIIALIDFIRNWRNEEQEEKKGLIDDFIDPVFSLFKEVHNDYLLTFRKYQNEIESNKPLDLSSIIMEIEQDSLFSQNSRDELLASLWIEEDLLSELVKEISDYLKSPELLLYSTIQPWSNVRRESLIRLLRWINGLTPENIIDSGLFNDVQLVLNNQSNKMDRNKSLEYLISSLGAAATSSITEINRNEADLNLAKIKINEIKRYLAFQCINFIIKETQESYSLVVNTYWQLKLEITGLNSN